MRIANLLIFSLLIATCTPKDTPLSERMAASEMARCPEASYLDGREGTLKWNYTTGLELQAILEMADQVGHDARHSQPSASHSS